MKIGIVGNSNVGKTTIFNKLTGKHNHTGNWNGKTTEIYKKKVKDNIIYDLPGITSMLYTAEEEKDTYNFIINKNYDLLIIVVDSVYLEKSLNLILQILEITDKVIICMNMIEISNKKGITINYNLLESTLNTKIILNKIKTRKEEILKSIKEFKLKKTYKIKYIESIEQLKQINNLYIKNDKILNNKKQEINKELYKKNLSINEIIIETINERSNKITKIVQKTKQKTNKNNIDKILTHKISGSICMLLGLLMIFWITIKGANYPSEFLYNFLFSFEDNLYNLMPNIVGDCLVYGVYRVLAWVIAVMLPPMIIFFPLFNLLEDLGYLPRIAFNLDGFFQKCNSCGKQAINMMMSFGCNVIGVTGSRIINSKREKLISILTNSFIPCNGRFPMIIALITMFFATNSFVKATILTGFIILSVLITLLISKILSLTILKGKSEPFILKLPYYRKPMISKILIESILDRTYFVLKRALIISAPAGLIIWLLANITIGNTSILNMLCSFLNPLGNILGLDGVILMAFILGFPANEIVLPLIIMGYMSLGHLTDYSDLNTIKDIFVNNGWTNITVICTIIFSLMHFPCFTTLTSIKKETNLKYTLLSMIIPLITGSTLCITINLLFNLL